MAPDRLKRAVPAALVAAAAIALFVHARGFDFICDDAFITLRYAKNLATLGAPIYNVGERVEGYTNFLWMLLAALGFKLGLGVTAIVTALGALSAAVVMGGVWLVWSRFEALPRAAVAFALAAVALSAPVAVWTLGGLETCLYAGLLAASCGLAGSVAGRGGRRPAVILGVVLALATLTRPEGALAFGIALGVAALLQIRRPGGLATLGALAASYLAVMVPYVIWRRGYYGDLLPNTFYLKTSGNSAELRANGIAYLRVAASDLAWVSALLAGGIVAPAPRRLPSESEEASRARRATLWILRLNVLAMLPYIVSVGGDFLGGYRFLVPLLPLASLLTVAAATQWFLVLEPRLTASAASAASAARPGRARLAAALAGAIALAAYGFQQVKVGRVINAGSSLARPPIRLEPLDWTRLYAKRWAALGRWIGERARPDDLMAGGAAGAAPYYAGIGNIDTLGLTDRFVARHGIVVGSRPGHQRAAPVDYLLSRSPVFLFHDGAFVSERHVKPKRDPRWESLGYVWVEAKIDQAKHGSPSTYYFHFQVRKDRAASLAGDPFAEVAALPDPAPADQ